MPTAGKGLFALLGQLLAPVIQGAITDFQFAHNLAHRLPLLLTSCTASSLNSHVYTDVWTSVRQPLKKIGCINTDNGNHMFLKYPFDLGKVFGWNADTAC